MGQLDIHLAQQMARENERTATRQAEYRRRATERHTAPAQQRRPFVGTIGRGILERLHLTHRAAPTH